MSQFLHVLQVFLQLTVRFAGPIAFEDQYEDGVEAYRNREFRTTTKPPPPPPPPIVLDPAIEEMMKTVNWTEIEIRFGGGHQGGISVRGAFGDYEEEPVTPAPYQLGIPPFLHQHHHVQSV